MIGFIDIVMPPCVREMRKDVCKNIINDISGPWVMSVADLANYMSIDGAIILDGASMRDQIGFYQEIEKKFLFPEPCGRNFNALSEMLSDLSWLKRDYYVVLIGNFEQILEESSGHDARTGFEELLSDVGEEWGQPIEDGESWDREAVPFHSVISRRRTNLMV